MTRDPREKPATKGKRELEPQWEGQEKDQERSLARVKLDTSVSSHMCLREKHHTQLLKSITSMNSGKSKVAGWSSVSIYIPAAKSDTGSAMGMTGFQDASAPAHIYST